ncbi:MAG: hypothetical protein Kow0059_06360 [Candidatus Sumerlaeia bacterium]
MGYTVQRVDTWVGEIEDKPGALAAKLEALAAAGASLEFAIARRAPDKPGTGVVFLAPIKGARALKTAAAAGLCKAANLHTVRIEGPDRKGLGAAITRAVADAGLNLRGFSAAAIGKKAVIYLALDTTQAASKAAAAIRKALK